MQTLWNFDNFTIGHTSEYFQVHFERAKWESLGDLQICDPKEFLTADEYGCSGRLKDYFSNDVGMLHNNKGFATRILSEAAGFRLRWSLEVRCLKIEPGQWNEPAPLPKTNPSDFLFWYCPIGQIGCLGSFSRKNSGGLLVTPEGEKGQKFKYKGSRAVLIHNMPHLLLEIDKKASEPYYCFYGQLQEAE